MASLKPRTDLKIVLLANTIILGIGLILFSHTRYFPAAMFFATLSGFGAMSQNTVYLTIIQVNAELTMRGRVMSYVALACFGMLPLGSLLTGAVSQKIGAPNTILSQGILALMIAALFSKFLRSDKMNKKNMQEFKEGEDAVMEKI